MEEQIIKKVENLIKRGNERYKADGGKNSFSLSEINGRIFGLLDALEIMTGKEYIYDENGVRAAE